MVHLLMQVHYGTIIIFADNPDIVVHVNGVEPAASQACPTKGTEAISILPTATNYQIANILQ